MSLGLAFWVLMLVWLCFSLMSFGGIGGPYMLRAGGLLEFVLFLIVGWKIFGKPIQG